MAGCTDSPDLTTEPSPTEASPTPTETPELITLPDVAGKTYSNARGILRELGLDVASTRKPSNKPSGKVIGQRPAAGTEVEEGDEVVLILPKAPPPPPSPSPSPKPKPPPPPPTQECHPSYTGACLDPNASDYDCAGGSGDGPKYTGRVNVVGPDEYDLDSDGDGVGCE